jgi:hypothetical protein
LPVGDEPAVGVLGLLGERAFGSAAFGGCSGARVGMSREGVVGGVAVDRHDGCGRCESSWCGVIGRGLEKVPDAAGEVALEAAHCFAAALAFGLSAGEIRGGVGVQSVPW